MRQEKRILGVLVGLLLPGAAFAQTNYGDTGLFVHPTAAPSAARGLRVNLSYLHIPSSSENREGHWIPLNVAAAIGDRADIGATYLTRVSREQSFGSAGLFGRLFLLREKENQPAVALAGNFLGGDIHQSSLALAATKSFAAGAGAVRRTLVTVHGGVQYVHWKDDDADTGDVRPYLGVSVPLIPHFALIGEIGSRLKFDRAGTAGIGVQWNAGHGMNIGTGYVNNGRSKHGGFFFGIGRPILGD